MFHRLVLTNFKKHKHLDLHFHEGLHTLIGPNASGKTTVLRAILFALHGPSALPGSKAYIGNRDIDDANPKVMLELTLPGGRRVTLERSLRGAKILDGDGKLLANGASSVAKFLEEEFRIKLKDLLTLQYSEQGGTQDLLREGMAPLQKLVERLSRTQLVDAVMAMVSEDSARDSGALAALGTAPDLEELRIVWQETVTRAEVVTSTTQSTQERLTRLSTTLDNLQKKLDSALELERARERCQVLLTRVRGELEQAQQEQQKHLFTLQQLEAELDIGRQAELTQQQDTLDAQIQDAASRLHTVTTVLPMLAQTEAQIQECRQKLAANQKALDEQATTQQRLEPLRTQYAEQSERVKHLERDLATAYASWTDSRCPTCQRAYEGTECDHLQAQVQDLEHRLQAAREVRTEALRQLQDMRNALLAIEAQIDVGLAARLSAAEAHADALRKSLAEAGLTGDDSHTLEQTLAQLREHRKQIEQDLLVQTYLLQQQAHVSRLLENAQTRLVQAEQQSEEALAELEQLQAAPNYVESPVLREQLQETRQAQQEAQQLFTQLQVESAHLQSQHRRQADTLEQETARARRIQETEHALDQKKRLGKFLRDNRATLMQDLWARLLQYASHLLHTATDGVLHSLVRDKAEFFASEGNAVVPVTELSGFQRSLTGLVLRIALSKVFYGEHLSLLLDEPAADAVDANAARLAGLLQGLGTQVLMVSHRQGDTVNSASVIALA